MCESDNKGVVIEDDIKWMSSLERFCSECQRKTTHNRGIKYADGKEVVVLECWRCKEITEVRHGTRH